MTDRVALERGRPEPMRENGRAVRLRPVVAGTEEPPSHGAETHDLEIGAADDPGTHRARLAEADHRELDGREVAKRGERFHPPLQVAQLGYREVRVLHADALRALAEVDQAVLVAVDERPEQHAPDDAENGGVRADAEGQRENDGKGQAPGTDQRTKGELEVGHQRHRRCSRRPSGPPILSYRYVEPAALFSTSTAGVGLRRVGASVQRRSN